MEHDQVLLDYEKLTTEQEGLLGVLEENLKSDDACFEAKRLLCALFQVWTHCYRLQLHYSNSQRIVHA